MSSSGIVRRAGLKQILKSTKDNSPQGDSVSKGRRKRAGGETAGTAPQNSYRPERAKDLSHSVAPPRLIFCWGHSQAVKLSANTCRASGAEGMVKVAAALLFLILVPLF